jgi:hypothetical protein
MCILLYACTNSGSDTLENKITSFVDKDTLVFGDYNNELPIGTWRYLDFNQNMLGSVSYTDNGKVDSRNFFDIHGRLIGVEQIFSSDSSEILLFDSHMNDKELFYYGHRLYNIYFHMLNDNIDQIISEANSPEDLFRHEDIQELGFRFNKNDLVALQHFIKTRDMGIE